jgi:uncharacterized protein (TIGR00730 family)
MNITVFGGANPGAGSPAYEEAYQLGRLLAQAGHTVLTGGYLGTMEAVSRGANEAGGHVIGVTCSEIEAWRKVKANAWVKEEWAFPTLRLRLFALIDNCAAAIALPGGAGTMTEIALTWNSLIIGAISPRPLILVGEGWRATFAQYFAQLSDYVFEHHRALLTFAPDVEAAVRALDAIKAS